MLLLGEIVSFSVKTLNQAVRVRARQNIQQHFPVDALMVFGSRRSSQGLRNASESSEEDGMEEPKAGARKVMGFERRKAQVLATFADLRHETQSRRFAEMHWHFSYQYCSFWTSWWQEWIKRKWS